MPETPKRPEPQSRTVTPFQFLSNTRMTTGNHPSGRELSFSDYVASRDVNRFVDDVPDVGDDEDERD